MLSNRLVLSKLAKRKLSQRQFSEDLGRYIGDPAGFIHEVLKVPYLTCDQLTIIDSVLNNPQTHVKAAHGVGKTALSSWLLLYWVFVYQGLCISSSPTARQTKELLWGEVRKAYDRTKNILGGERGQLFVKVSETARAYGFSSVSYDSNSMQGIHHDKLLIILDEACGITDEIWSGAQSCVTGSENRLLTIGNPIVSGTPFEKSCARGSLRIPAWSHPNVSWAYEADSDGIHRLKPEIAAAIADSNGEILPQSAWPEWCPRDRIAGAVSIAWVEKCRAERGESSAFWQSRVEGLFPTDSEQSIIPRSWFLAARMRYDADPSGWDAQAAAHSSRHGLDVGDGGDDHAHARWRGPVLYSCMVQATKGDREDVTRAAGLAVNALKQHPGSINVDTIGVGSGALAILLEQDYEGYGINWGGASDDPGQFLNCKAEQHWLLREALRTGIAAIGPLGEIEEMVMEDLSGTYYEETSTGKIRIEDKAKTRKRLHRSPNAGDSVIYGFTQPNKSVWAIGEAAW